MNELERTADDINIEEETLVDTRVAARILGISPNTLQLMRNERRGPPYFRIGSKTVRYSVRDLNDFVSRSES